jgi:hypothetical protein
MLSQWEITITLCWAIHHGITFSLYWVNGEWVSPYGESSRKSLVCVQFKICLLWDTLNKFKDYLNWNKSVWIKQCIVWYSGLLILKQKVKILNIYLEWKTTVEGVGEPWKLAAPSRRTLRSGGWRARRRRGCKMSSFNLSSHFNF